MIELQNLNKTLYEGKTSHPILKDINLKIAHNESVVLKGASGSGKSTLLNIIASIMKPTSGKVLIEGKNIVSFSDIYTAEYRTKRVGFVTQNFHLFEELSVEENLLPSLVMQKLSFLEIQRYIDAALCRAHIEHKRRQKASTLSAGEKQRVVIARAIVNRPDILICDEPTANLDLENSLLFIETLKELKKSGTTIIIATHDQLFNTQEFIDKTITLDKGRLL